MDAETKALIGNLRGQIDALIVRITSLEQRAIDEDGDPIGSSKADLRGFEWTWLEERRRM